MSININYLHAAAYEHLRDKTILKPLWEPNYTNNGPNLVDKS